MTCHHAFRLKAEATSLHRNAFRLKGEATSLQRNAFRLEAVLFVTFVASGFSRKFCNR